MELAGAILLLVGFAVVVAAGVLSRGPLPSDGTPHCGGCGSPLSRQRWQYAGTELCEGCAIRLGLPPLEPPRDY